MPSSLSDLLSLATLSVTVLIVALGIRQKRAQRRRWPGGVRPANCFSTSYALGNALHSLQQIVHPAVEYAIVEENDEDVDQDESGDPPDPCRDVRRQMARVRRGERLDRLVVRIR